MYVNRNEEKLNRIVTYVNEEQHALFMRLVKKYGAGKSAAMREILIQMAEQENLNKPNYMVANEK